MSKLSALSGAAGSCRVPLQHRSTRICSLSNPICYFDWFLKESNSLLVSEQSPAQGIS